MLFSFSLRAVTHINLVGKHQGKRALVRPMYNLENNIKMDGKGVDLEDMDWIYLEWDRDQCQNLVNI
jgi:hypothetical protein